MWSRQAQLKKANWAHLLVCSKRQRPSTLVLSAFRSWCDPVGFIGGSKLSEARVLRRKRIEFPLRVRDLLSRGWVQVWLWLVPKIGKWKIDRQGCISSDEDFVLVDCSESSVYQPIHIHTLTCGHKLWAVTKRMRLELQAVEMSFLWKAGLSLSDSVASSVIQVEFRMTEPLLHTKRSQLHPNQLGIWLGCLLNVSWASVPGMS